MNKLLNKLGETIKLLNTIEAIIKEIGDDNRCKKLNKNKHELIEDLKSIDNSTY